jgi:hypothetical protein
MGMFEEWLTWYKENYTEYVPMENGEPVNLATLLSWRTWQEACSRVSNKGK